MAKVKKVLKCGILRGKVKVGDEITGFNDRPLVDVLDYIYADSQPKGEITLVRNGEKSTVIYEKLDETDTLGLEFDDTLEIKPRECKNNCIFCFVRQLPQGLRDTLYVRDDDYRLSFISGSYITGTNLTENDVQRIIDYRLSPLYVSVHTTDDELRKFMLGVKKCNSQTALIDRLVKAGITIHSQIVLVGGINDGEHLQKTLQDLYDLGVSTVAVVPVGLTAYREGKYPISPLTKEQAKNAIEITENFYKNHISFCYCSDEMYQIAEMEVRGAEYYGEYEQIENGVGLIPKFLTELEYALSIAPNKKIKRKVGIFTGVSGEKTMLLAKEKIREKYPEIEINIYVVKNDFFGRTVTVTGLVTATDIIKQYKDKMHNEDFMLIPSVMLKEFEDVFLDGISLKSLSKSINKKILVNNCDGEDFFNVIFTGRSKKV